MKIKRRIPLADLRISAKAKEYVLKTLNNNRLSYGPFMEKFEKEFAKLHNRKYAIMTNSGTSGLMVALSAFKELDGWSDGDEIIVPAVTFIATSNAVIHNNLRPVFVDVEKDYYCIDPTKIEEKITQRTRAIMPVHLFGQSADMEPILKLSKKYNLKIIEDSCETMFVKYRGQPVGSLGDIAVFSTYVAHIIVTGVGGMVTTNDELLATTMKSLAFHGRDSIYHKIEDDDSPRDDLRLNSLIERRFEFHHVGYSYRLTEMEAALGLAELGRRQEIIKKRKWVGEHLTQALRKFSRFLQLPEVRPGCEHIYMLYPIIIRDSRIEREDLVMFLEKHGVETRLFMPLLTQPIYKRLFGDIEDFYPVAKELVARGFLIGSHPYVSRDDIVYVGRLLENFLRHEKLLAK